MEDDLLQEAKEFLELHKREYRKLLRADGKTLYISFEDLSEYSTNIADSLIDRPDETLQLLDIAASETEWIPKDIRIRFSSMSYGQEIKIKNIRAKHLGKMIKIIGVVKRSSGVRPQAVNAKFECPSCGTIISVLQIEKDFKEPSRCSCGRKGGFKELSKDLIDFQLLSIEELQHDSEGQPERIKVLLKEDLVSPENRSKSIPGTEVEIIGILKETPIMSNGGKLQTNYDLMIEANNIISLGEDQEDLKLTEEEEEEIKELSKSGNVLEKITTSMAPSIKGHEDVKKTLALQLFGGVKNMKQDGTTRRGDIHVLLVGDPGVAKSVMLSFVNNISPKCRIVAGKSTSTAGLIGGAVMDDLLKCWSIEAGAMAMMSGGCLIIDEFEKVNEEDRSSLHQAMEQQEVTIQKIVSATLKTETSILAAANPKWGRFNPAIDLGKQINMIPSLLSRFDAIFIMRDIANKEKDSEIADMVLDGYDEEELDFINAKLLKKYIAYARQHINPKLNKAGSRTIKDYYIKMRGINGSKDAISIGTRQLEGMVRLAQAHARMRLSNTATDQDAIVAIGVMSDYLKKMGFDDETNSFDIDKITGISASQRSKVEIILRGMKTLGRNGAKLILIRDLYMECRSEMDEDDVDVLLDKIETSGDVFRPKRGFIQLM